MEVCTIPKVEKKDKDIKGLNQKIENILSLVGDAWTCGRIPMRPAGSQLSCRMDLARRCDSRLVFLTCFERPCGDGPDRAAHFERLPFIAAFGPFSDHIIQYLLNDVNRKINVLLNSFHCFSNVI